MAEHSTRPAGPAGQRTASEQGIASLEMAILFPVILLIVLGIFQISLYWHTANAAEAAAERGVDVGQIGAGDAEAAERAARQLLAATKLRNEDISAVIGDDLITVTVATDAPRIVGLGTWRVRSVAQGRLERFVPADER